MKKLTDDKLFRAGIAFMGALVFFMVLGSFGLSETYRAAIQNTSQSLFMEHWDKGYVVFKAGTDPLGEGMDTKFSLINRVANAQAAQNKTSAPAITTYLSFVRSAFSPFCFLLALIFASPVSNKRKLYAVLAAFLIFHIWVFIKLWIGIAYVLHLNEAKLQISGYSNGWGSILTYLDRFLVKNVVVMYMIPVLIWIGTTFNKADLQKMGGMLNGNNSSNASAQKAPQS